MRCGGNTTRRAVLGGLAGLALAPRARARPALIPQQAAQYRPRPNGGMSCAFCTFFRPPGACAVVAGPISPHGWCKFFDMSD